eukprot:71869-Chlamydomonas_euryale.AAC.2
MYPYHLADYVCRVKRITAYKYYCDLLASMLAEEASYDRMPNFTVRCCMERAAPRRVLSPMARAGQAVRRPCALQCLACTGCVPSVFQPRIDCVPVVYRRFSGGVSAVCQHWPCTVRVTTMHRLCTGNVPAVCQHCSGCVPAVYRLCTGSVPALYRLRTGCVPAMYRQCT